MHSNAYIYSCIWLYIPIYAAFRHVIGALHLFTVHSHQESWCALHQANTAMVQCQPTSMRWAAVPSQRAIYGNTIK